MTGPREATQETAPDVLDEVNSLIAALAAHPDAEVRAQVDALLAGIDTVHRAALTHLMEGIRGMAGDAFVNRLVADPAIRLLLMSYDLISVDRRLMAEEALDPVRSHLHGHGVDVELLEVVGGTVYVRLHGVERAGVPAEAVRQDLETALADGLIGFQQLELRGREPTGGLVRIGASRRLREPVYGDAAALADVPPGALRPVDLGGTPVLLVNVAGDVYAVQNRCGDSPLPLEFGTLDGATLLCSWHGCRYDVRSGRTTDPHGQALAVYPVSVEGDRIRVAVATREAT